MGEPRFVAAGRLTRIRAFTRRDVDRWLSWPKHDDGLYSAYNPTPMDGSVRDAWYKDLVQTQGQLPFAIESLDRVLIGRLFLRHVKPSQGAAVLGIDLDPRYLGRGYGTDALRSFLRYYFGRVGFRRMYLSVAAHNVRARRSYERCGFRYLGTHWEVVKCEANVLGDARYAEIRPLFRAGQRGLEALMHDMLAEPPTDATA